MWWRQNIAHSKQRSRVLQRLGEREGDRREGFRVGVMRFNICSGVFLRFRCLPVCGAHLLSGSALHVPVHSDGNLPIRTEEAEVKRSAITLKQLHFDPFLIYHTFIFPVFSL